MASPPGLSPGTRDLEGRRAGNCATGTWKWSSRPGLHRRPTAYQAVALLLSYATELADEQGIPPWTVFRPQPLSKRCPRVCRSSSMAAGLGFAPRRPRRGPGGFRPPSSSIRAPAVNCGGAPWTCTTSPVRGTIRLANGPGSLVRLTLRGGGWRDCTSAGGTQTSAFRAGALLLGQPSGLKLAAAARFARAPAGFRDQCATDYTTRHRLPGLALLQQHPQ